MEDIIDNALKTLVNLPDGKLDDFKPKTVGERIAFTIISISLAENDIDNLKYITERTGGRTTAKISSNSDEEDLASRVKTFLGG